MSMTNKYDGVCASRSHRTDPETGEVMPLSAYRQHPDAVNVPAGTGSYVRGMVFCADCTAAFAKRREERKQETAAKREAKATAKYEAKIAEYQAKLAQVQQPVTAQVHVIKPAVQSKPKSKPKSKPQASAPKHPSLKTGEEGLTAMFGTN